MELDGRFTEHDMQQVVNFLNMGATHAKLTLNTQDLIKYFKLLSHMQQVIIPKIEANIFEVKKITKAKEAKAAKSEGAK